MSSVGEAMGMIFLSSPSASPPLRSSPVRGWANPGPLMKGHPTIDATVTLLSEAEGSCHIPDGFLSALQDRPHIVMGDRAQREPAGERGNVLAQDYLAVACTGAPQAVTPGAPPHATIVLACHPRGDYAMLAPGPTFSIREAGRAARLGTVTQSPGEDSERRPHPAERAAWAEDGRHCAADRPCRAQPRRGPSRLGGGSAILVGRNGTECLKTIWLQPRNK